MREPTVAQVARMRCTEILMDRYQPEVFAEEDDLRLLSRGWRAKKRLRLGNNLKTARAMAAIRRADASITPQSFVTSAKAIFHEFHNNLAQGHVRNIYDMATESFGDVIRANPIPYADLAGTQSLTEITSFLDKVDVRQARLVQLNSQASSHVFAQITLAIPSEARIVQRSDFGSDGGRERMQLLATRLAQAKRRQEPGRFCVAFDSAGGDYYYHFPSNFVTWKRPPNYLVSRVFNDPLRGTLGVLGRTTSYSELTRTVFQEHIVVFERPLFNLGTPWRVCFF